MRRVVLLRHLDINLLVISHHRCSPCNKPGVDGHINLPQSGLGHCCRHQRLYREVHGESIRYQSFSRSFPQRIHRSAAHLCLLLHWRNFHEQVKFCKALVSCRIIVFPNIKSMTGVLQACILWSNE